MAKQSERQQLEDYLAFLKKRLESKNYKARVPAEEYEETAQKYKNAKLRFKFMKA